MWERIKYWLGIQPTITYYVSPLEYTGKRTTYELVVLVDYTPVYREEFAKKPTNQQIAQITGAIYGT